jgi:hypothetical protein
MIMGKLKDYKPTILFSMVIVIFLAITILLAHAMLSNIPEGEMKTKDFRNDVPPVGIIHLKITWLDEPLENTRMTLLDENFTKLETVISNSSGEAVIYAGEKYGTGTYYVNLEYDAEFVIGGVEYWKKWIIVDITDTPLPFEPLKSLEVFYPTVNDMLTITVQVAPADWPDEPDIRIE